MGKWNIYAQWNLNFAAVPRDVSKQRSLLKESGRNPLTYHSGHFKIGQNKPLENLTQWLTSHWLHNLADGECAKTSFLSLTSNISNPLKTFGLSSRSYWVWLQEAAWCQRTYKSILGVWETSRAPLLLTTFPKVLTLASSLQSHQSHLYSLPNLIPSFGGIWKNKSPQPNRKTTVQLTSMTHTEDNYCLSGRTIYSFATHLRMAGVSVYFGVSKPWKHFRASALHLKRKPQLCGVVIEISRHNILMLISGTVTNLWLTVFLRHFWSP